MKTLISLILFLIFPLIVFATNTNINLDTKTIILHWHKYKSLKIYNVIDKKLNSQNFSTQSKNKLYKKLLWEIDLYIIKLHWKKDSSFYLYKSLQDIIRYWIFKTNKDLQSQNITKKVILGYSEKGLPIIAYYRWDPNKWFFGIFSNIHWGHEYWTYRSALKLKEKLEQQWKTGWFIIPTINPDWLELYKKWGLSQKFYKWGRVNSHKVDLNRNFCTKNFQSTNEVKKYSDWSTKILKSTSNWQCWSESEVKTIVNTLKKYKFNKVISLHSLWKIFYIPNWTLDNQKILQFWKELKSKVFLSYDFYPSYQWAFERKNQVIKYEFDLEVKKLQ